MNTSKDEFLSALLDDEAGDFERRRLLDELGQDDELARRLGNYALIGELMRSEQTTQFAQTDLLAGIHAQLEEEPAYHETVVQLAEPMSAAANDDGAYRRKPLLQYGLAAALALATVGGVMLTLNNDSQAPVSVVASEAPSSRTVPQLTATSLVATSDSASQVEPELSRTALVAGSDRQSLEQTRASLTNRHLDRQTRDTLKQYVTLHMQHRGSNVVVPIIQAASYSQ